MAIAKMKKIKLISFHEQKEAIMQILQGMQSVELIDMSAEYEKTETISSDKKEALDDRIKEWEKKEAAYRDALQFLQAYLPKISMLKKMRQPRAALSLEELEAETSKLNAEAILKSVEERRETLKRIEEAEKKYKEEEEFLIKWRNLKYNPHELSGNKFVSSITGTVPQTASDDFMRALKESPLLVVEEVYQTREEYGITVYFDLQNRALVQDLLDKNHFFKLNYPFASQPEDELKKIKATRTQLREELSQTKKQLSGMKEAEWQLMLINETIYAELQRLRGQLLLVEEKHLFILEGWMEDSKVIALERELTKLSSEDYALLVEDVKAEETGKVPIVLENSRFVAPFENITTMYSLPKYDEIDPTPFLTPFYLLFFGMMLADLGYGLLLWAGTFAALKFFHLNKSMRKNMEFFNLLSYSTMLWGLIYGSIFGVSLPIVPLSTTDDVNTILLISVVFGVVQMLVGLSIKTYLYLRDDDKYAAVSDGIGWITIFVGIILLVLGNMVFPSEVLSTAGGAVAVTGALSIILASSLGADNKALGAGAGLYNLYGITGYVGDIVSYTRLMALGVSGGSIALAFNMIIGFLPTAARFTVGILLFVVLHMVNFGLSALSAYVHGARLIFVEFFGKFYEGGGKALNPLKTSEEFIDLKNKIETK